MKLTSLSDEVRANSHLSSYLPVALHSDQKKLLTWLLAGKNMVVSALTSFGKSLVIEGLVASKKYRNIVIIQPCRFVKHIGQRTQWARASGGASYVSYQRVKGVARIEA